MAIFKHSDIDTTSGPN